MKTIENANLSTISSQGKGRFSHLPMGTLMDGRLHVLENGIDFPAGLRMDCIAYIRNYGWVKDFALRTTGGQSYSGTKDDIALQFRPMTDEEKAEKAEQLRGRKERLAKREAEAKAAAEAAAKAKVEADETAAKAAAEAKAKAEADEAAKKAAEGNGQTTEPKPTEPKDEPKAKQPKHKTGRNLLG